MSRGEACGGGPQGLGDGVGEICGQMVKDECQSSEGKGFHAGNSGGHSSGAVVGGGRLLWGSFTGYNLGFSLSSKIWEACNEMSQGW